MKFKKEFKNESLIDRLRTHKCMYILKRMGLDVPYDFFLGNNGPFSSELAEDLEGGLNYEFRESKIDIVKEVCSKDVILLELIATVLYIDDTKEKTFKCLKEDYGKFEDRFEEAWDFITRNFYTGLFCPRCGEKLESISAHLQDKVLDGRDFIGFDVYCENCEFGGYIHPDDTRLEKAKRIERNTEETSFFPGWNQND